jgi:hypothetical protein
MSDEYRRVVKLTGSTASYFQIAFPHEAVAVKGVIGKIYSPV